MAEAARREDWPRTLEEFEVWHASQPERWEFIRGEPRLMAPASMRHSILKTNVGFELQERSGRAWLHGPGRRPADPDR